MKSSWTKLLSFVLAIFLLSACSVSASGTQVNQFDDTFPSQFLMSDVYVLKDREKIDGNIAGVGTKLVIEEGATVTGSISLIDSQVEIFGNVNGDINVFSGTTHIHEPASIGGDINQLAHQLEIDSGARILGKINTFTLPDQTGSDISNEINNSVGWIRPSVWIIIELVRNLSLIFINLLIVFLFKIPILRIIRTITHNIPISWGVGLLVFFGLPIVALVLLATICLSPIGILLIITYLIANVWAWTGISLIIGNFLAKWLKLEWSEEAKVTIGSLVIGMISTSLAFIPLIGLVLNVTISAVGMGGIVLSKLDASEKTT